MSIEHEQRAMTLISEAIAHEMVDLDARERDRVRHWVSDWWVAENGRHWMASASEKSNETRATG